MVEFGGTKELVISTLTVMGGRNPFLGIAYVVVGGLCVILGVVFAVAHLVKPRQANLCIHMTHEAIRLMVTCHRKLGDHTYLNWNNDQHNTATATGVSRPGNDAA